jgi:hypothetical protein
LVFEVLIVIGIVTLAFESALTAPEAIVDPFDKSVSVQFTNTPTAGRKF